MSSIANINTVEQLKSNLPQAGEFLGSVLGWEIPSDDENTIEYPDLMTLAVKYSIPTELLPVEIKPKKAMTRSVVECKKSLDKGLQIEYIRKPKEDDSRFVLGIVERDVNEDENLEYQQQAKITFNVENDVWECDNENFISVLEELKKSYKKFLSLTCEDIRFILREFVKKHAIRLNPDGKSYFVPHQNITIIQNIELMLKEINKSNDVMLLDLFSTPKSQEKLNKAAIVHLEDEILDLEDEINEFLNTAKCSDKMFDKGLEIRKKRANDIKLRIQVFSSVLSFQHNSLLEKLDELCFIVDPENDTILKPSEKTDKNENQPEFSSSTDSDVGF